MSAERAYPYGEGAEPLTPPGQEPRFHGTLAPLGSTAPRQAGALNEAAESIGSAMGKAVDSVQHLSERLQEMRERFTVIRGRAQRNVASKTDELKAEAVHKVSRARSRADRLAHEYPLRTILAMAGVGLLLGVVLRIWRDHAD